jgi:hypothetical protein
VRKIILISVLVILFDLATYVILGLMMMNYDDFYDPSKGEYGSWASMTPKDQIVIVSLNVWNIINLIAIGYLLYKLYLTIKKRRQVSY